MKKDIIDELMGLIAMHPNQQHIYRTAIETIQQHRRYNRILEQNYDSIRDAYNKNDHEKNWTSRTRNER